MALQRLVKFLTTSKRTKQNLLLHQAFATWRLASATNFYQLKLSQAAQMIDRMSKFSRNFISLNTLSALV